VGREQIPDARRVREFLVALSVEQHELPATVSAAVGYGDERPRRVEVTGELGQVRDGGHVVRTDVGDQPAPSVPKIGQCDSGRVADRRARAVGADDEPRGCRAGGLRIASPLVVLLHGAQGDLYVIGALDEADRLPTAVDGDRAEGRDLCAECLLEHRLVEAVVLRPAAGRRPGHIDPDEDLAVGVDHCAAARRQDVVLDIRDDAQPVEQTHGFAVEMDRPGERVDLVTPLEHLHLMTGLAEQRGERLPHRPEPNNDHVDHLASLGRRIPHRPYPVKIDSST
jgi:hypothetical protein